MTLAKEKRMILPIPNHVINTPLLTLAINQVERELEDTDKRSLVWKDGYFRFEMSQRYLCWYFKKKNADTKPRKEGAEDVALTYIWIEDNTDL